MNPYIDVSYLESTATGAIDTRFVTPGVIATFEDGGTLSLDWTDTFERLSDTTAIIGADVPAGDYHFATTSLNYTSSGTRMVSGELGVSFGDFYDGDRTSLTARVSIRPNPHMAFEVFGERNDLRLAGRSFDADAIGGRVRFAPSTRLLASAFVQYVELADELVANFRVNYIHAPLSDIFLVFTERRAMGANALTERVLTLKVTKLLAF